VREEPPRPGSTEPDDGDPRGGSAGGSAGAYLGVGLQFAVSIVLFVYLGQWLDRRFGTEPWLLLAGLLVGGGASFYSIYRKLMANLEREEAERRRR
jgi:ATP synthase protein I